LEGLSKKKKIKNALVARPPPLGQKLCTTLFLKTKVCQPRNY
jgi:hypothetical protein